VNPLTRPRRAGLLLRQVWIASVIKYTKGKNVCYSVLLQLSYGTSTASQGESKRASSKKSIAERNSPSPAPEKALQAPSGCQEKSQPASFSGNGFVLKP
jgi:hypothetical protein